jgi:2-dehydro-3-deoxyphosphogluconate aldolase/(4S)-4-hydroxy-2-oxoglutarate aldolase
VSATATLSTLAEAGVIAVLRAGSARAAVDVAEVLIDGGVRAIEVTFTTPGAVAAIAELSQAGNDVIVGAGTVTTARAAEHASAAGARFLVSPGTLPALIRAMRATGRLAVAGALTPSEVLTADRSGAHVVKLFPASLGGPSYLRGLRGPFPDIAFMPSGGITAGCCASWFEAGAAMLGVGGDVAPAWLEPARRAELRARAEAFVQAVADARR